MPDFRFEPRWVEFGIGSFAADEITVGSDDDNDHPVTLALSSQLGNHLTALLTREEAIDLAIVLLHRAGKEPHPHG